MQRADGRAADCAVQDHDPGRWLFCFFGLMVSLQFLLVLRHRKGNDE